MLQRTLIIGTFIPILIGFICTAPATIFAAGNEEVVFVCAPTNATGTVGTVTPGKKKSWFNFFSKSEPTTITIDCSKGSVLPPTASSSGATVPAPPKKEGFLERLAHWLNPPQAPAPETQTTPQVVKKTPTPEEYTKTTKTVQRGVTDAAGQAEDIKNSIIELDAQNKASKLKGKLHITARLPGSTRQTPNVEYITITADRSAVAPNEKVVITGLTLKSQRGMTLTIPGAAALPLPGQQNFDEPVSLRPGDKASIITGMSPNGLSFRINKCTGTFSYNQTFTPALPDHCPLASDEPWAVNLAPECLDYLKTISSCAVPEEIPLGLTAECQSAVLQKVNYNSCVDTHKYDFDFYEKDWRIYLKRSARLWRNVHETIQLLDTEGKVIDEIIYP